MRDFQSLVKQTSALSVQSGLVLNPKGRISNSRILNQKTNNRLKNNFFYQNLALLIKFEAMKQQ